ncbi:MAG TPA: DUF6531 domain-containing protein [Candidatus Elarobacter sp.]|nr:DUF6531 domain-containing protein [Candidatus Elarobacter sp.]
MPTHVRAALAALLSLAMFVEIAPAQPVFASTNGAASMRRVHVAVASAVPPARIPVKEPLRVKQRLVTTATRAKLAPGVRSRPGVRVPGPPMLRPSEIDAKLRASAHRRTPLSGTSNAPAPAAAAAGTSRRLGEPGTPHRGSVPRAAQSLPSNPSASGTGINPWWRYQEQNLPGGDHAMINIGTGNLLLQRDDMSVPHKGISMTFRRTYNSQALAAQPSTYGSWQSLYGTGWTNTFDAHLLDGGAGHKSVYDIDGTRYDYGPNSNGAGYVSLTPGNHATLVFDGSCGYLWTKKGGTTYYFWRSAPDTTACPSLSPIGGYAGRLYQIIGRNRNTFLTFQYLWDNGDASSTGKVNTINVTTESGMTTSLVFADVNGRRLLQTLTYPDATTSVQYAYDASGNLAAVSHPSNNAAGARPQTLYGYQSLGSDSILEYEASPRWCGGPSGCGYDGSWTYFGFSGTSAASSTLALNAYAVTVNPTIQDGTNTPLYSGYRPDGLNYSTMRADYYTTGVTTPTFRDTDGHMTNWVVDGTGRPLQTQECTASTNQGQQCTSTWLVTNEVWDVNNNLVSEIDPRGYESDYAYDAMGNAIAVAQPQTTTTEGTFRPTSLYDYDAYNNVTAYCDPSETHAAGADWTSPPSASDTLCSSHGVAHTSMSFSYPANEPYGQLTTITSPLGYSRHIAYDVSKQGTGGSDFGLPTSVQGDPITQTAGQNVPAQVTPLQSYQYNVNGNVVCYSDGVGTSVIQYDALGRPTAHGDPDDGSLPGCGKASSSYTTASYKAYFPDGSLKYSETPIQHAADVASGSTSAAVSYTYDLDGNVITETHHHGCTTTAGCTAGVTTKWYDGADRLVEVMLPHDAKNDYHTYSWLTRHLYDLSLGGTRQLTVPTSATTSAASTQPFLAYGNQYDTQEYVDLGWSYDDSAPRWVDHLGTAYDALDRKVASYDVARSVTARDTFAYDQSTSTLGLQATHSKATGEVVSTGYDELGHTASVTYPASSVTNAAGGAPSRTYSYDARGNVTRVVSALGTETLTYDADSRKIADTEPAAVGGNTVTSSYAGNGWKTSLSTSGAMNGTLFSYSRLPNGALAQQQVNSGGWKTFTWQSTAAGRVLQRTDPTTGRAVSESAPLGILMATGTASVFGPLTYAYNNAGALLGMTYSDGLPINSISTDLEGNQSYETFASASDHVSEVDPVTVRGEDVGSWGHVMPATFANGIRLPTGPGPLLTPQRDGINPVSLVAFSSPGYNSAYNPLDGFAVTTTGTFYDAYGAATYYTNAYNYDASGRMSSTDLQQCSNDNSGNASSSESMTTYTYDADDHMLWQANGSSSAPSTCSFGGIPGHNDTYAVNWGTSGHPISITDRTDNTFNHSIATYPEYLHWDGDTLLFTSGTPSGPPDNIKVGSIAEIRPSDGAIQVFDRDTAGEIWDGHTTVASGWNDSYGRFGGTFDGPNPAFSFGAISEPRPQNLTGWGLITIQGVRGVDGSLTQWTTPDAYAGSSHDPASQKPYMYEGNNSYAYSDPSGYCTQRIGDPSEDCGQGNRRASDGDPDGVLALGNGRPHPDEPVYAPKKIAVKKTTKMSGKERNDDAPSWAMSQRPRATESPGSFAERILNEKYGQGNLRAAQRGAKSEYSKIKKWASTNFHLRGEK